MRYDKAQMLHNGDEVTVRLVYDGKTVRFPALVKSVWNDGITRTVYLDVVLKDEGTYHKDIPHTHVS